MDHSSDQILPLETLRAFDAAARTGSFSAAAEKLNLTHGAVSRQIAKLEDWLGLKVFERNARGVSLTIEGNRLHLRTTEAFALISVNSDRWVEPRGTAVVRLASIPSVSGLWLMPRMAALENHPTKLRIVLDVDNRQADLADEGIDLSVRCGRGRIPGRVSVQLFEEQIFPIASPELAKEIGRGDPARLLKYPLINDSDASGWRAWLAAQDIDYRPRPQDRRFEDYNLVLDAAAHGLGIALARPPLTADQLRSGRIVAVDERVALNPVSYWMDRPVGRPRAAAADLAGRIAEQAGLAREKLEGFLQDDV
ncbi:MULTISPECIES: LysR substrate-binding domain-containing protein [unclassified Mesorhizobium]|uniref:LysR substrate-binding domain-containing protein n=1 Tax=unclassified Mesorhizobium TaxID=325217 RepID=UPI000F76268F|nr:MULTISPECIES: LysR substrate-binding domain-containing protein [unclassified Mesorhizobium]AZO06773.1 LysR family transcriptional regulator [Mesorhizobium sp. M2A.F.Ca.ET.043.02.1.1]RUW41201.1 LysR family transcriptional regulator [Mesorhizobium sp. M2A.F.Ca.ET.015.02.1.1]RUW72054.1 LysR family transcriptional regulator [Mesorhizobium sp. M2A.F.Ca.ET.067.02.1.1]RVC92236.1 LysR family transcriptional regulator [Mesorhizobium sp. M2A.F.Ca.ET.017.03.2.1]RWB42547.1 MAG: LysR family transcriptio